MSIDFIPIQFYTPIYYHVLLVVSIFILVQTWVFNLDSKTNLKIIQIAGVFILAFVILYMGFRPIHQTFADMAGYAGRFYLYKYDMRSIPEKDYLFHIYMYLSSKFISVHTFFLICAILYVLPSYFICKSWFKEYWFYAFLMIIGSFSFWAYGTNGIRNGIATSFFLMALASNKRIIQILWLYLAVNFHGSMMLPTAGLVVTWFYNQPKGFYYFWLLSIPLSLAMPGVWENLFAGIVEDERAAYLTNEVDSSKFARTGFRWDFLLYSATGVFAGTYYLFKKKLEDKTYISLFNIYLFANAFWILVIRANFSNRFAYLSWFLLALVIVYPWLKFYFEKNQHVKLGVIVIAYYLFTYLMAVIL